ncbi:hypothetical protein OP10G_3979 [Fimbriimonas ginsengisoli Gsoil 348]|uniref:Uncharacterized protein n=1 Tax=Fimbriimonas ginsengisoli Gsoil 348 TaxID=661478 RepID=A0A068NVE5_FIMGI|nr:hypothetical protein OP10G_3979 [Fimbriimonas ginsengisoli Gsoil 348]
MAVVLLAQRFDSLEDVGASSMLEKGIEPGVFTGALNGSLG